MSAPAPPTPAQMDRLGSLVAPLARVTQPEVLGLERLPDRPALYVGNHTLFAFLDLPFMMDVLWREKRIYVRGLGDHGHYAIPVWRNLLELCGMVRGTRENVRALMHEGQNVLVFPGGANEVFKKRGQKYQLLWKERLGFARLAMELGYPIVPFAAVGAEDMVDVVADNETPVVAQVSDVMRRLVGMPLPPLARGIGPTPLPRPERLYFWFGEPVDSAVYDDAAALRDDVRTAVERGIEALQAERRGDPRRSVLRRLLSEEKRPSLAERDPDAWFVHKAFEAWNEAGPEGAAAWLSPWAELQDPPGWPEGGTWRGRAVVVDRLSEVWRGLGGGRVDIVAARSLDEGDVVLSMRVGGEHAFFARVGLSGNEIVSIRVELDEAEATAERRSG